MGKSAQTAKLLAIAKVEYDNAQAEADEKKKVYEQLRRQIVSEMVSDSIFKFQLKNEPGCPALSFRLETKSRWSPVVENKDKLIGLLKVKAPEIFTITAPTLSKYINEKYEQNNEVLPSEFENLVKKYDDTHVVVRTIKA